MFSKSISDCLIHSLNEVEVSMQIAIPFLLEIIFLSSFSTSTIIANFKSVLISEISPVSLSHMPTGPKKLLAEDPEANFDICASSSLLKFFSNSLLHAFIAAESPLELEERPASVGMLFLVSIFTS